MGENIDKKTAIFSYLFYEDLFEKSLKYLSQVPNDCDVYIATDSISKLEIINSYASSLLSNHNVTTLIHDNKGRDVSAFLILFNPYYKNYDLICFIHDKKSSQMKYASVGRDFNNNIWDALLYDRNHINSIIDAFCSEPHLGVLVPPMVTHGEYFHTMIDGWTICYDGTVRLANEIGLNLDIKGDRTPLSYGTAFWARTGSLQKLFDYDFSYDMFPEEPIPVDGTISHCVERLIPYVALDFGFYTGVVYTTKQAKNVILNNSYSLNQVMKRVDRLSSVNTATLKSTLDSLEGPEFEKKPIPKIFIDSRIDNNSDELIRKFKKAYDPFYIYRWIRDQLVIGCMSDDNRYISEFRKNIWKTIRYELFMYRYRNVNVIIDAIDDFMLGVDHLNLFYRKYQLDDVSFMNNIDENWYQTCRDIKDCDSFHKFIRTITINGYLIKPKNHIIVSINKGRIVQAYRAKDIVFFDDYMRCGYICRKNVKTAFEMYRHFRKSMHALSKKYNKISMDYRSKFPEYKNAEDWMRRLNTITPYEQDEGDV